jgi:hypothetical protein
MWDSEAIKHNIMNEGTIQLLLKWCSKSLIFNLSTLFKVTIFPPLTSIRCHHSELKHFWGAQ